MTSPYGLKKCGISQAKSSDTDVITDHGDKTRNYKDPDTSKNQSNSGHFGTVFASVPLLRYKLLLKLTTLARGYLEHCLIIPQLVDKIGQHSKLHPCCYDIADKKQKSGRGSGESRSSNAGSK
jgi:hypothetical protein